MRAVGADDHPSSKVNHPLLRASGNPVYPATALTEVRVIAGTAALAAVFAVFALAAGAIVRHGAGAVTAAISQVIPAYPQVAASYTPSGGYFPLAPRAGFAVSCAWAALALALAASLLRRRDT